MTKKLFALTAAAAILSFYSCKKDDNNSGSVTGNWKFVSISAKTQSIAQYNDGVDDIKSITNSEYTSTNNAGSVSFSGNTVTATGLTYDVNATGLSYFYTNGVLTDSASSPYYISIPAYNSTSTYQIIGADSIRFANSGALGAQTTTGASSSGGRFTIDGVTMLIKSNIVQDTVLNLGGLIVNDHEVADATITLQRQ